MNLPDEPTARQLQAAHNLRDLLSGHKVANDGQKAVLQELDDLEAEFVEARRLARQHNFSLVHVSVAIDNIRYGLGLNGRHSDGIGVMLKELETTLALTRAVYYEEYYARVR